MYSATDNGYHWICSPKKYLSSYPFASTATQIWPKHPWQTLISAQFYEIENWLFLQVSSKLFFWACVAGPQNEYIYSLCGSITPTFSSAKTKVSFPLERLREIHMQLNIAFLLHSFFYKNSDFLAEAEYS